METIKENVVIDKKFGHETTQVLLEGDIIVPDAKPDVSIMLQAVSDTYIDSKEIINERINFKGRLDINILYISKGDDKPVHSISSEALINDFISMDAINSNMLVEIKSSITNIDYKIINDRKISYRAVIDVTADVISFESYEIVKSIENISESQLRKNSLNINKIVCFKDDRIIIKDEINVPAGKPNIRDILQCNMSIGNKEIKVMENKIMLSGEIVISLLYKGDNEDSFIEFMESEIPFNGAIEVNGAENGMFADVEMCIQDKFCQSRTDSDGEERIVDIELSVGTSIKISQEQNIELLEDAYCINKKLNMIKIDIKYPSLICRNKNQFPVKEVVQFDDKCPNMFQIFRTTGKVNIDDMKVIDDKVIVEGIINCDILYVAESDDIPLYCYNAIVPFRQVIETKGAKDTMLVNIDANIEHIGFNMLSKKEVELRCVINFDTVVIDEKDIGLISDIEFIDFEKDELDNIASMTIYVVQPGDTLWKIAKRYNTSIDDIISVNDIENPNKIYPGQKLLILKKIFDE